ncbi:GH25 family lysozyme [Clostridium oryzae]|uniref:Lysozyme M1 n=1 Tax=Clostridium oryzae TaxID=1450648 RepID=A0A1V4IK73_9CLOT|nr:GH25 family lysozyme [Clostridium oryzae]OPJ60224.1 lysozyme M1 precursor [Clostridium oryzae]
MKKRIRKIRGISCIIILIAFILSLVEVPKHVNAETKNLPTSMKVNAVLSSHNGDSRLHKEFSSTSDSQFVLDTPESLKAEEYSYDSITVSWSGVTGASGYEVYRAESSDGPYNLILTSVSTSCIDKGVITDKTYYYKVRAYTVTGDSKIYSDFTPVVNGAATIINVVSVGLDKKTDTLTVGDKDTLAVSIKPKNATNQSVMWNSSDETVAKINSKGKITAVGAGKTIITVITVDGGITASCTIIVKDVVKNPKIKGIDVSKWQNRINWSKVKRSGVKFAMIRASYGSSGVDQMFSANYASAKANGIAVGAYHYSYATTVSRANKEVNFFIKRLKGKKFEYPICVDVEDSCQRGLNKKKLTNIVLTYLRKLSKAGYYPMIYANRTWYTTELDDTRLKVYDHWLAQWGASITYKGKVGMWQYTSSGKVKGINGRVDMDISYVDYAAKIKKLHKNGF